ncbi:MAG: DEAD/DEAH box helicase [Thermoplasmata archaeon]|nr:DEAD/DEAH box helicase [Thermoplasmata archaeon]
MKLVAELGLPDEVKRLFLEQGITALYPPQELAIEPALAGKNVVVAVPTASGKSLIAYLSIAKGFLEGKKAVYIVPLRALANEKYEDLRILEKIGARVGISTGDYDAADEKLERMDIVVMTAEKADALMRHHNGLLEEAGIVVADEVHLLADSDRGPTMEILLTNFLLRKNVQIIALSATVNNSAELADWLNADHISMDWRPVVLREGVFCRNMLFYKDGTHREVATEGDAVVTLTAECIRNGGQMLIFTNTRKGSETTAKQLSKIVRKELDEETLAKLKQIAADIRDADNEVTSAHESLAACVLNGCAYHNASLTNNTRKIVEQNFRKGLIKCIAATPTLAAGINLPARRVIVKEVWRYSAFGKTGLPVMEVKQMCGRAGRPKYDREGEAILLAKNPEHMEELFNRYINGPIEDVESNLSSPSALRKHVLALIATGRVKNLQQLEEFISHTFLAHQEQLEGLESLLKDVLSFLSAEEFIRFDGGDFQPTLFGVRTSELYIDPVTAVIFRNSMLKKKPLSNVAVFHTVALSPDMEMLITKRKDSLWLESFLQDWESLLFITPEDGIEEIYYYNAVKTAAFLHDWVHEVPEDTLIKKYDIGPGDIHNKVELAEWLLHAYRELSKIFAQAWFMPLDSLLVQVKYGIKPELLPLVELPEIGRVRARNLYRAGVKTREDLRNASVEFLASIEGIGKKLSVRLKEYVSEPEKKEKKRGQVTLDSF